MISFVCGIFKNVKKKKKKKTPTSSQRMDWWLPEARGKG